MSQRWDIFCKVVDNLGDIGVCWRLARQLHAEHGLQVRLWVDDLASFQRICPAVRRVDVQQVHGVDVRRWSAQCDATDVADVVIDAFGCGLPETYQAAMRDPATVWVNLEYLTAEPWAAQCHGRASLLPGCAVKRWFFFPGFDAGTGGLLRERDLLARRDAFVSPRAGDTLRVLLFCYDNPSLLALIDAFKTGSQEVELWVPEGAIAQAVGACLGGELAVGQCARSGRLAVRVFPLVPQDNFDELLWAMDVNFVRGEDSFVRAQWAALPFIWQAYPQEGEAHLAKVDAFLARYCEGLAAAPAEALRALWRGWNEGGLAKRDWEAFVAHLPALRQHARGWADTLARQSDLASALVQFCAKPV